MQPENPDYSFLTENPKSQRMEAGGSKKKRIMIVVVGGALLITVFGSVMSLLLGGGEGLKEQRLKIAQQHIELIRVAEIGTKKARSPRTVNLASTIRLSFKSTKPDIVALVEVNKKDKKKGDPLEGGKNQKTDERLKTAEQNNRFDEVFLGVMNELLSAYQKDLNAMLKTSKSAKEKEALTNVLAQIEALIQSSAEPQGASSDSRGVSAPAFITSS